MDNTHFFYRKPKTGLETFENDAPSYAVLSKKGDDKLKSNGNLWDEAHKIKSTDPSMGYIEPDVTSKQETPTALEADTDESQYDSFWPHPVDETGKPKRMVWHVGDDFSQLKSAWDNVSASGDVIRIAHLDTGYDPHHTTFPENNIEKTLQRNLVEGNDSAVDVRTTGGLNNPGHGSGTLSILAGNKVNLAEYSYNDYLGIHNNIKVVPIRMSPSVILWKNKAFVDAMNYVISLYDDPKTRCHIVTMSMGGLPLKAWAEVVNKAYEKGIFIVTAAGNNIGRFTPNKVIYPSRFNRVMTACGVNYDYSPYYRNFDLQELKHMQGNFGPRKVMRTAVAAFTPNVTWALIGTGDKVSIQGAGTSSATPQIAAAAALYYQKYYNEIEALGKPWMKVEAIRNALVKTAEKKINQNPDYDNDVELFFGKGVLQAKKMHAVAPVAAELKKEEEDEVSWPFFRLLSPFESLEADEDDAKLEMYETEMLQLIQQSRQLQDLLDGEQIEFGDLDKDKQKEFYTIVLKMDEASLSLKNYVTRVLNNIK